MMYFLIKSTSLWACVDERGDCSFFNIYGFTDLAFKEGDLE